MVMGADGSDLRKLPTRSRSTNVGWSLDGTKLTFDRGKPPGTPLNDVYTMD
jgi:hypothetical protein